MKIDFIGVVSPASPIVQLKKENAVLAYRDVPGFIKISYNVDEGAITAEAEYDSDYLCSDFSDIGTLTGVVLDAVQFELNIVNLVNGTKFRAEILEYNAGDGWYPPNPFIPAIRERENESTREEKTARLYALMSADNLVAQIYLNQIVSDLNLAIRYPIDTAFYCFRAVETMARYFCESMSSKKIAPKHINAMLKNLKASRDDFELLKKYADSVRHGNVVPISSALRATFFDAGWKFLDAFIEFAENDFYGIVSSYERDVKKNGK